jgi:hypothetical protein
MWKKHNQSQLFEPERNQVHSQCNHSNSQVATWLFGWLRWLCSSFHTCSNIRECKIPVRMTMEWRIPVSSLSGHRCGLSGAVISSVSLPPDMPQDMASDLLADSLSQHQVELLQTFHGYMPSAAVNHALSFRRDTFPMCVYRCSELRCPLGALEMSPVFTTQMMMHDMKTGSRLRRPPHAFVGAFLLEKVRTF